MYSLEHILYIIISLSVISLTLYLMHFVKKQKLKNFFLLTVALACFFMHISMMYVTFFQNGNGHGNVADNQIFPIYFCNYMMYLLLAVSFWGDKETKLFKSIATFTAWGGIFGALITLFATPPGVANWSSFQSAFSHSFLLLGSLYLFTGKYISINVYNLIPFSIGLLSCGIVGGFVEMIYYFNGMPSPNPMYFHKGPPEAPFFNCWLFAISILTIIFIFTMIWEYFTKKPEDRWYKSTKDMYIYFNKINVKSLITKFNIKNKPNKNINTKTNNNISKENISNNENMINISNNEN